MQKNTAKKFEVSHVNIRLSISFLLLKLFFVELLAAIVVIIFHFFVLTYISQNFTWHFSISIFIFLVFIKMIISTYAILLWLNEYYEISADLITHRKGLIIKHDEKYPIEHIRLIEISQGLMGKILNYGSISLYDQRRNKYMDLYQIHNPMRYAEILEEVVPELDEIKTSVREHIMEPEDYYPLKNISLGKKT